MSSPLKKQELLSDLQSAASEVCFSESPESGGTTTLRVVFAEAEEDFRPEFVTREESGQSQSKHREGLLGGLASSLLLHGSLLLVCGMIATAVRTDQVDLKWTDPIRATLADDDLIDPDPQGEQSVSMAVSFVTRRDSQAEKTQVADAFLQGDIDRLFAPERFEPTIKIEEPQTEQKIVIQPGSSHSHRFERPGDGRAVTKGSFTVWTEPADPLPRQPYFIVFQIRVPEGTQTYPKSDLRIDVEGTDTFHLQIPDPGRNFAFIGELDVIDGTVQFVLPIPGAQAQVRDRIRVESRKILREKQQLMITF